MAKKKYLPPVQKRLGQLLDTVFILALVYLSLLAPLLLHSGAETGADAAAAPPPTWESLGQNATMQAQWEKLGIDATQAAAMINHKFDYSIDPLALAGTALVIVVYFVFMLRVSEWQYRQVIAEKFDEDYGQQRPSRTGERP
ncbi:MAG TPA: hypothetical protein VNJ47_14100 [Nevskiales bacterium]|nr:hypothetical protein [Nevskiales bacterium]